jgi:hypothetical protein
MATIHINRGGNSLGTFSEEDVRAGLRSGRFAGTDLGWREGMASWQPLSQFSEFAADIPAGAPPPAPPPATSTITPAPVGTSKTEPLAIWSLVLSLVGIFCCAFVFGVPGIICGHLALSKIRKEPGLQGYGIAVAGLVIGYASIAFWLIYVVFFGGIAFLQGITQGASH